MTQPIGCRSRRASWGQLDLWQPDYEVLVGFGQQRKLWVLVMTLGYSRMTDMVVLPGRLGGDLMSGSWLMMARLGRAAAFLGRRDDRDDRSAQGRLDPPLRRRAGALPGGDQRPSLAGARSRCDWNEVYRTTYREYVANQREKDAAVLGVRAALSKPRLFDDLDPGWVQLVKFHSGAFALGTGSAPRAHAFRKASGRPGRQLGIGPPAAIDLLTELGEHSRGRWEEVHERHRSHYAHAPHGGSGH